MLAHLTRRLLSGLLLMFVLTLLTYLVFFTIPGDPGCQVLSCQPGPGGATPAQLRAVDHRLGLDRPVLEQYGHFVWRLVRHGSLGHSWRGYSVGTMIKQSLPVTASLVLGGIVLVLLLAVPLGLLAALRPQSLLDRGSLAVGMVGLAVHPFVLGIGAREISARVLHLAPPAGYCPLIPSGSSCSGPVQWAYHLYVPWIVFALFFLPLYMRMIRVRLLETMSAPYVTVARAKGAGELRVLRKHVLRNAISPVVSMMATDAGTALTSAIYIETIFAMPGLGQQALSALSGESGGYDLPAIVGIVFTVAVAVVVLNTAADLATAWLDPRLRLVSKGLIPVPQPIARLSQRLLPQPTRRPLRLAAITAAVGVGGLLVWRTTSQSARPFVLTGPIRTVKAGWVEQHALPQGGALAFRVRSLDLGRTGWSVHAAITNRSKTVVTVTKGYDYARAAGLSLVYPEPATAGSTGNLEVVTAETVEPPLRTLAPGGTWQGSFSGKGRPPLGKIIYVGFGLFTPKAGVSFTYLTDHSFILQHER
jgi:peptide/nickel transport system permease protein